MQITGNISSSMEEEKNTVQNSLVSHKGPTSSQRPNEELASEPINNVAFSSVSAVVSLAYDINGELGKTRRRRKRARSV